MNTDGPSFSTDELGVIAEFIVERYDILMEMAQSETVSEDFRKGAFQSAASLVGLTGKLRPYYKKGN